MRSRPHPKAAPAVTAGGYPAVPGGTGAGGDRSHQPPARRPTTRRRPAAQPHPNARRRKRRPRCPERPEGRLAVGPRTRHRPRRGAHWAGARPAAEATLESPEVGVSRARSWPKGRQRGASTQPKCRTRLPRLCLFDPLSAVRCPPEGGATQRRVACPPGGGRGRELTGPPELFPLPPAVHPLGRRALLPLPTADDLAGSRRRASPTC